jgi:hypothetical protein
MREVCKSVASSYAEINELHFGECSALTGEGVEEAL